jgi:hypothetical protein
MRARRPGADTRRIKSGQFREGILHKTLIANKLKNGIPLGDQGLC